MTVPDDRAGATRVLSRCAAVLLGLLTGAMLVIGVALVPYWAGLPAEELHTWFRLHAPRIAHLMIPLGGSGTLAALAAAILGARSEPRRRRRLWLAAAAAIAIVAVTGLVNEPINEQLWGSPSPTADETARLIGRWSRWHLLRVGCGLVAFYAALRGAEA